MYASVDTPNAVSPEPATCHDAAAQMAAAAFEELRDNVFHFLVRALRDAADAEDLTQVTFLRYYRVLCEGERIALPRAWIFKVARNLMIDRLRQRQYAALHEQPEEAGHSVVAPDSDCPEHRMIRRQQRERLRVGLEQLKARERDCIRLRAQGLRLREIGWIVGLGPTRVADLLSGAVKTLQRYQ